ncbi:MAG: zf-TFIIB domain-containing protein [Acidobacteria bacterium]|nr:zf-TFIIB domain-containing protein [Acidobacteriota bacterium]
MLCPVDQATLLMMERQGIEIDYCPTCRGVWLDRGELDKLIEGGRGETGRPGAEETGRMGEREMGSRPEERPRVEERYRPDERYKSDDRYRPDERYSSDDRYKYEKKKKKEGFLKDLFDF